MKHSGDLLTSEDLKEAKEAVISAKRNLEEIEERKQREAEYPSSFRVAYFIHERQCKLNHYTACNFSYTPWSEINNTKNSKKPYIDKAEKLLQIVDEETAYKVIEALCG